VRCFRYLIKLKICHLLRGMALSCIWPWQIVNNLIVPFLLFACQQQRQQQRPKIRNKSLQGDKCAA